MRDEIKPCPFCASNDIYYVCLYPWGAFSCDSCKAAGPAIRKYEEEINFKDELRMEEAKKAWNQRIDWPRMALNRVKRCNEVRDKLADMLYNSVWKEGFKHVKNKENDYEEWREHMRNQIIECIELIELIEKDRD